MKTEMKVLFFISPLTAAPQQPSNHEILENEGTSHAQSIVNEVSAWCTKNKLQLHPSKRNRIILFPNYQADRKGLVVFLFALLVDDDL